MKKLCVFACLFFMILGCSSTSKKNLPASRYVLSTQRTAGKTLTGESIIMGGFSSLQYLKTNADGSVEFLTISDRGPNTEYESGTEIRRMAFLDQKFTPSIYKLRIDKLKDAVEILEVMPLKRPDGKPLTGLYPFESDPMDTWARAVDQSGKVLPVDFFGVDPEGMYQTPDGHFWVSEEYFPSLVEFDSQGKMLKRYIPYERLDKKTLAAYQKLYGKDNFVEALPQELMSRQVNRGFEGLTYKNGKVYAAMQSPLTTSKVFSSLILEFDLSTRKVTEQILYPFTTKSAEKIGDLVALPTAGREFLVIEQNSETGPKSFHRIYKATCETGAACKKDLVYDLVQGGTQDLEKIEGLALGHDKIYYNNDQDYGIERVVKGMIRYKPFTQTVIEERSYP